MRVIFLGTPQIAVPTLEKLITWPKGQVVAVVTQPDKPSGRGNKMTMPPVKEVAQAHNIPVLQPEKLSKSPDVVAAMQAFKPDVIIMVAFGQILKKAVLEMAPHGVINLHASLLPKYRGPAPINWAIINGDSVSGITTMFTDAGVDTGAMLLKSQVPIGPDSDSIEYGAKLAEVGANLVIETLEQLLSGRLKAMPQDDSLATKAPTLSRELGIINWFHQAESIHNLVRGLKPWPGTSTSYQDQPLKIISTRLVAKDDAANIKLGPAEIKTTSGKVIVGCGQDSVIELVEVQPPNKSKMSAQAWANGVRLTAGVKFDPPPPAESDKSTSQNEAAG